MWLNGSNCCIDLTADDDLLGSEGSRCDHDIDHDSDYENNEDDAEYEIDDDNEEEGDVDHILFERNRCCPRTSTVRKGSSDPSNVTTLVHNSGGGQRSEFTTHLFQ